MINLQDVGVRFGSTEVLRHVTGQIARGDYLTITGRSGSGKSTLLNVMAGTVFPTAGVVQVDGIDLRRAHHRVAIQRSVIGYLFQSAHLVGWMSAEDNVALGMRYQGVPGKQRRDRARDALDLVGLAHRLKHRPAQLSGGERQRVALARAVARRPKVLLADEPTGNLDVDTGAQVIELLEDVGAAIALVLVTHNPAIAARGARRWQVVDGAITEERRVRHAR